MATQLKPTDYQPIPFLAARPRVRVAFSQPATTAIARALDDMPAATRDATLEALTIGADADALIATARHVLSPHVYDQFLEWGEAAALALDGRNDDDAQDTRSARHRETVEAIYRSIPVTFADYAFKTWIAGIEVGDCSCLGPLRPVDVFGTGIRDAVASIADDLARISTMACELDRFACRVQFLAGTAFKLPAPFADAIAASFDTAQQVFATLPVGESFARREVERTPTPFYRGLLIDWDRALRTYQEAAAELRDLPAGSSDATVDTAADRRFDALSRVLLTPAPSPASLAIKLRLQQEAAGWELKGVAAHAAAMTSDARRFAKMGACSQADAPLLTAFDIYRSLITQHAALPRTAPKADEDALYDRMDQPETTILQTRATTIEGVIVKLRYGFEAIGPEAWVNHATIDPTSAKFRAGLEMGDMHERTLWEAIEDLARIAGVDLAAATPSFPPNQHRGWFAEREAVLERIDSDDSLNDEQSSELCGRLNELDNQILETAPGTIDELVTQFVLAAQLQTEGHRVVDATAARLVANARRLAGIGTVRRAMASENAA